MDNIVYWCLHQAPQPLAAMASLTPAEQTTYQGFRFEARCKSWLAGRFTAKYLLASVHNTNSSLDQFEIRNDDLGAPYAYHADQPLPGCLSISHSGDWAAAAYTPSGLRVGIDLETITAHSDGFIQDYFTQNEVEMVFAKNPQQGLKDEQPENHQTAERATLVWSAKEALLKALGIGLRLDTRQVEVIAIEDEVQGTPAGWMRLTLSSPQGSAPVEAYWRKINSYLVTLAVLNGAAFNIALVEVN